MLSHGEPTWREANRRRAATGEATARISAAAAVMARYFAADTDDDDAGPDPVVLNALLAGAGQRRQAAPGRPDDLDRLRRRLLDWQRTA